MGGLPAGGTGHNDSWPPRGLEQIYDRMSTWAAWYSGDLNQLGAVYGGPTYNDQYAPPSVRSRGVKGVISRWFWGTPANLGQRPTKLHIPLASDIAEKSADLLFADAPKFTSENASVQKRLDELMDDGMQADLLEAAEIVAGLGGGYLRVVWDEEVRDRPWISAVHPDAAVPEWRWGVLTAVTFWRVIEREGTKVLRHLERHEKGAIMHGLYEGTDEKLGKKIPLTDNEETRPLTTLLGDNGDTIDTGVDKLAAVYIPNMRPNRVWRDIAAAAPLGRADIAGSEPQLDALDEVWSSWMRDIRLGKGRVFAPDIYLQSNGPGQGASFNAEQEIYAGLNMLPKTDGTTPLTIAQFNIRVDEHSRTAQELMEGIIRSSGYSTDSFGMKGDGVAATATEINDREKASITTREKKTRYWGPQLRDITETLLLFDAKYFASGVTAEEPKIEWPDAVSEDPTSVATTLSLLETARAMSTKTKVEMLHPDWDETAIAEEADRIQQEGGFGSGAPADPINVQGGGEPDPNKPPTDPSKGDIPPPKAVPVKEVA